MPAPKKYPDELRERAVRLVFESRRPLVSPSVDSPPVAAAFRAGIGARWTFLCDPEREAQRELGLHDTTDAVYDPYVPAVLHAVP